MKWMLSRLLAVVKSYWWLFVVVFAGFIVLIWFGGQGWALVVFSAALVVATIALAIGTDSLARANFGIAEHQIRAEFRDALDAAKEFIEINPMAFVDVVKGPGVGHPSLNAIDKLARYVNVLHDKDTVRDVQQFAADMDNVKISNAAIPPQAKDILDGLRVRLVKLQGRVAQELVELRRDLASR